MEECGNARGHGEGVGRWGRGNRDEEEERDGNRDGGRRSG